MVRSLAWRLQLWQGLMLLAVVAGLGTFVYLRLERTEMERIDTELESAAQVIAASFEPLTREAFERGDFEIPLLIAERRLLPPADRPLPPRDRPAPPPRPRREAALPEYIVWNGRGDVVQQSEDAPAIAWDELPNLPARGTSLVRPRRDAREVYLRGPHGSIVMVSRSIRRQLDDLRRWRWILIASGVVAIALGTVGGAWLVRRSLHPIAAMTATAAAISGENLSERIETIRIDRELAGLARTLNDAFDRLEADIHIKARFAADASHELRTPLTVILGYLEMAHAQPDLSVSTREALAACLRAAKRMKGLVEQLLLLARADAGKLAPDSQPVDLCAIVDECVSLLAPLAKEKQVQIGANLQQVETLGDPALLGQVVMNLVSNAIQYHRPGGRVDVCIRRAGENVVLEVSDNGPGIKTDAQAHLFERFYRADAARSREQGGSGLGLAISQSIVRAHGGEIGFTSEVELGTTFWVKLPAAES